MHSQTSKRKRDGKMEWIHIYSHDASVCFISSWKMRVIYLVIKYTWGKLAECVCAYNSWNGAAAEEKIS